MTYIETRTNPTKTKLWNMIIVKGLRPSKEELKENELSIAIDLCLEVAEQCSEILPEDAKELITYAKTLK